MKSSKKTFKYNPKLKKTKKIAKKQKGGLSLCPKTERELQDAKLKIEALNELLDEKNPDFIYKLKSNDEKFIREREIEEKIKNIIEKRKRNYEINQRKQTKTVLTMEQQQERINYLQSEKERIRKEQEEKKEREERIRKEKQERIRKEQEERIIKEQEKKERIRKEKEEIEKIEKERRDIEKKYTRGFFKRIEDRLRGIKIPKEMNVKARNIKPQTHQSRKSMNTSNRNRIENVF